MSHEARNPLLEDYESMDPIDKWFVAFARYIWSVVLVLNIRIRGWWNQIHREEVIPFFTGRSGKGLVVILHGYKASRAKFEVDRKKIYERVKLNYPDAYAPFLKYEHNGTLEQLSASVLSDVVAYAQEFPDAPVLIYGISAGGRVGILLQRAFLPLPNPFHLVTVGSPLRGTRVLYYAPQVAFRSCGVHLYNEFHPRSMEQRFFLPTDLPPHHTAYHIYSRSDWIVFPPSYCITSCGESHGVSSMPHNMLHTSQEALNYIERYVPGEPRRMEFE